MDLQEFFRMGGYAGFVWTSYALTTVVLVGNWLSARRNEAEQLASAQRRLSNKEDRS